MQGDRNKSWVRKVTATVMLFVLAIGISVPLVFSNPRPAQAQFSIPISDAENTLSNIWDTLKTQFVSGAIGSLVNGANYFLSKLAYTLAVSLTSDCPGQVVCWDSQAFSEGLESAWQGAVGSAVETLSEEGGFSDLGLNLCEPDIDTTLNIQLGLLDEVLPPEEPACTWNSFKDNWSAVGDQFASNEVLENFSSMFQSGQSEMSVELGIIDFAHTEKINKRAEQGMESLRQAAAGGGFSDVKDPVSGRVKAPGSTVAEEYRKMQQNKESDSKETTETMSAAELTRGAFVGPLINMIQVFVQTFLSRLWNNFTEGLITSEEAIEAQPDIILSPEGIFRPPGKKTARQALTRLLAPPRRDGGDIDIMTSFSVCPTVARTAMNCVMDDQFVNAVRVGAATPFTVQGAIDEGYLHGDWPLISAADTRNQDPHCYTEGYCESNLKKLRAHRIIPIGWEIAASQAIGSYANIRLQDVINAFDDCNEDDERDKFHPFCHLIDPNWVLIAPAEQCRVQAYGPELVSSEIPQRAETCVDYRSCLQQDDFGQCIGGWGYCTREKNVWRMNGDQCPAEFNTCRTLTPAASGSPVSYLMNTVDFSICNSDNVGCAQYATTLNAVTCTRNSGPCPREDGCGPTSPGWSNDNDYICIAESGTSTCETPAGDYTCRIQSPCENPAGCKLSCNIANGADSCSSLTGDPALEYDDWLTAPSRYFDDKVESCDARDNGCSTLVGLMNGNSLNLITNSSFESMDGVGGLLAWLRPIAANVDDYAVSDSAAASNGIKALELDSGMSLTEIVSEPVHLYSGKMYTVSGNFKVADGDGNTGGRLAVSFFDASGESVDPDIQASVAVFSEDLNGGFGDCAYDADVTGDGENDLLLNFSAAGVDEIRSACSFFIRNDLAVQATLQVAGPEVGETVYVDELQLEEGPLTDYHEGYFSARTINAKVPPSYLGCAGEESDLLECDAFAGVCRETEVGCELYTPTSGDPAVPGIVSNQDYCPAECAGYDMFYQQETDFEVEAIEPDYFIPSTAQVCSAVEVGCSAFTNLETEDVEYYTNLRICQRPNDATTKTFYTWEGSDTTGYQLRAWQLQQTTGEVTSNLDVDGIVTADVGEMADICPTEGDVVANCSGSTAGTAPCVKLNDDATSCDDTPADRDAYCSRADIDAGDFDCREFYDSDGARHYRRLSHTIIATNECYDYRISGRSTEDDCHKFNGRWDGARDECIYSAAPAWSYGCSAEASGCRAYRGNAASNVQTLFVNDFESANLDWRSGEVDDLTFAPTSSESLVVGGHSAIVEGASDEYHTWSYVDIEGVADSLYTVSFWARGNTTLAVSIQPEDSVCILDSVCPADSGGCVCYDVRGESCDVDEGDISCPVSGPADLDVEKAFSSHAIPADEDSPPRLEVISEWRYYELGPIRVTVDGSGGAALVFEALGTDADENRAYIDNVILKRVRDNITVIRDSWNTPRSCDSTATGVRSPLEMLGCKEYRNSSNTLTYLRSFSALCRESAVGCQPYSNTYNTPDQTGDVTYNAVCHLGEVCEDSPNCPCDYQRLDLSSVLAGGSDVTMLESVCRVPVGQSQCRFTLEGLDVSTEAPACTENNQCDSNMCVSGHCMRLLDYPVCDDDGDCPLDGDCIGGSCVVDEFAYNDRFTVSADERLYLVVESQNMCAASAVGCTAMGMPDLQYERECRQATECELAIGCECIDSLTRETCTIELGKNSCQVAIDTPVAGAWRGATIRDNPADYEDTLCREEAVSCGKFTASDGSYYFKDPANQVCGFRTNVSYEGRKVSGWFRESDSGSVFPCYDEFIKDGSVYGIYRNRDILYDGWVGMCSAEHDRCEEFVDPLDVSGNNPQGQPYYYIDNTKLDKSSCEGQASLEQGCVPMLQTSSTQRLYSAAASYIRSQDQAGGNLVSAVNCDISNPSLYCRSRCAHFVGFCSGGPDEGRACQENADCRAIGGMIPICAGEWVYGLGCMNDNDCNSSLGETCEPAPSDLQHNDSNVILSVRRDRDCAEWLECSASMPVYDEQQGIWIERCSSLATCTNQVQVGDSFSCAEFKEVPREVLTVDDYASRDITWNGLEYSGYSLVDAYPIEHLLPYQVTQGQCLNASGEELFDRNGYVMRCRDDNDCESACMAGGVENAAGVSCIGDPAAAQCTGPLSGVCVGGDNNGLSCAIDTHCVDSDGIGFCSRSNLDTFKFGVRRSLCRDQDDVVECMSNSDCLSGDCAVTCTEDSDCPPDGYEAGCVGEDCDTAYGTCLQNVCVYDFHGGPLRDTDWTNAPACRAYPETNSPFSYRVLDQSADNQNPAFADAGATPGYNQYGEPSQPKLQFEGAYVCYEGNRCECSYTKVGYGAGSSVVRYHSADVTRKHRSAPDESDEPGEKQDFISGVASGICQGGPYEGQSCVPGGAAGQCGDADKGGGSCQPLNSYSLAVGWVGFCADHDYSTRLNADVSTPACNLWLPLDMMPGMTDSYSTNLSAGLNVAQDRLQYCSIGVGNAEAVTNDDDELVGGVCLNAVDEEGFSTLMGCSVDADCREVDEEYEAYLEDPICSAVSEALELCVDSFTDEAEEEAEVEYDSDLYIYPEDHPSEGDTIPACSGSSSCADWDCLYEVCQVHFADDVDCDNIQTSHDYCRDTSPITIEEEEDGTGGRAADCDLSEDLAISCHMNNEGYDYGPCNPYLKIIEDNDGETDHEGGNSGLFQAYQSDDPDGDLDRATRLTPFEIPGDDIAEIIIDIRDEREGEDLDKPMRISLNESNDWGFVTHFNGNLPDDVTEDENGIKYINNEKFFEDGCWNMFTGRGESWGDRGDRAGGDDRIAPWSTKHCIGARAVWDGGAVKLETFIFTDKRLPDGNRVGRGHHVPVTGAYIRAREICSEISLVHDNAAYPPSVPLMNRVYKMKIGGSLDDVPVLAGMENTYYWPSYVPTLQKINLDHTPFGAIASSTPANLSSVSLSHGIPVVGAVINSDGEAEEVSAGSPYYSHVVVKEGSGNDPDEAYYPEVDSSLGYAIVAGYPFSCTGTCRVPEVTRPGMEAAGSDRINELFAMVHQTYRLQRGESTRYTTLGGIDDRRIEMMHEEFEGEPDPVLTHAAPQVRPAMVFAGLCEEDGTVCPEFVGSGLSVNGTQGDICFGGGVENNVGISYYVKADSNHMPIRRHIVDFGDGSLPLRLEGSFKNHRGLDANGEYICGSVDDDFGLSDDACDPHYMTFNKTYVCSENIALGLNVCDPDNPEYPCKRDGCCVFKPRVQVMDNWGLCNGVCTDTVGASGAYPNGEGNMCFNSSSETYLAETYDENDSDNECTILNSGDRSYADDGRQPYTAFESEIIVCPNNCP